MHILCRWNMEGENRSLLKVDKIERERLADCILDTGTRMNVLKND